MNPRKDILSSAAVIVIGLTVMGCAWMDLNKDGKIDPIAYLNDLDVTLTWTDEQGEVYSVEMFTFAEQSVYNWIERETGWRFELAPQQDGTVGIMIRDPEGFAVWITPKAQ